MEYKKFTGSQSGDCEPGASDVLPSQSEVSIPFMIPAHRARLLDTRVLSELALSNRSFMQGDLDTGLRAVDSALEELTRYPSERADAMADMVAYRIFLASMVDQSSGRWRVRAQDLTDIGSGPTGIVILCVKSNEKWRSGSLLSGLKLNLDAAKMAHELRSPWCFYSYLLLAKKLTEIHSPERAMRFIERMEKLVDVPGFRAFEPVLDAMRAALYLQDAKFESAIFSATESLRIAQSCTATVGVKLALSVLATAHLGLGDQDRAEAYLEEFHAEPTQYVLPDSVARVAFTEIALVAARQGPVAAVDRMHSDWHLLGTESAAFVEDLTRPAWLVSIARRAGATALVERSLQAIDWLARNNPGVSALGLAAEYARATLTDGYARPPSILDLDGGLVPRSRFARSPTVRPATSPAGMARDDVRPASGSGVARPARLPSLSEREDQIARLVGLGMTNREVAKQLGLSPHTVNFHLRNIFRKLAISTRVKLGYLLAEFDRRHDSSVSPGQPS